MDGKYFGQILNGSEMSRIGNGESSVTERVNVMNS